MKIRRYTCANMQEALIKVKMDLGSEAVIMNSRKVRKKGLFGIFSKPMIEVVAAIDDDYVRPSRQQAQMRTSQPVQESVPPVYQEPPREQPPYQYNRIPSQYPQNPPPYGAQPPYYNGDGSHIREEAPFRQSTQQQAQQSMQQPVQQAIPQSVQPMQQPVQQPIPQSVQQQANRQPNGQSPTHGKAENAASGQESADPKIAALENKVKDMETMLEQIYKAVSDKGALEASAAEGKDSGSGEESGAMQALRTALSECELDIRLIDKIIEKVSERNGGGSLTNEEAYAIAARVMTVLLGEPETISLRSDGRPQVVIFIGPTGVGKTTTLAKIAADFTLNKQKKVGLITADTYRIAAVEQLKTYAEILNIPVTIVYSPNEIQDAIKRLSDKDLILIDTAGRSHRNKAHFEELKNLVNAACADEVYLVISANTGRSAAREILEYYSFIRNYKLLFTKLDEAPAPGIIINSRYSTGKALSYTTAGQSVPDDLDVANPKAIVSSILGQRSSAR
jgi:flagellar biosynthesis protein FlhF